MTGHFGTDDNDFGAFALTTSPTKSGAFFRNDSTDTASAPAGSGAFGLTLAPGGVGLFGANNSPGPLGRGVQGNGPEAGVGGWSQNGTGMIAQSETGDGLVATTHSATKVAVFGSNDSREAASAPSGSGVFGLTVARGAAGVFGANNSGSTGVGVQGNGPEVGISGWSEQGIGARGLSGNIGLFAQGGKLAAQFVGNVELRGNMDVVGDIRFVNADCAEDFDLAGTEAVDAGTVMVFDDNGELMPCAGAYDRRVAGVISGAGRFRPALVLDQRETGRTRQPLALMGKVYCQVDAAYGDIAVGDLLTTSPTPGRAMAAADPIRAFGSVIGKALAPHKAGLGLIPILVSLQ